MSFPSVPVPGEGSTTVIISWFLLVVSAMAIFTRLATKWATRRTFNLDDCLAVAALMFNLGSSIAVHVQAIHGLGYSLDILSSYDAQVFMKGLYALGLTYIPTLCFAKLSIIALLKLITPDRTHHRMANTTAISIALGAGATELAAAFQCDLPRPWEITGNRCYERAFFWRFVGAFNIITDCMLIALPLVIIAPRQMKRKKKLLILISFSTRFLDVAASSTQLAFTGGFRSSDLSHDIWKWVLLTQLTQCISIVTSCVPYLRPLLESLPTGMFLSDELRRRGLDTSYMESQYQSRGFKDTPIESISPRRADLVAFEDHTSEENRISDATSLNSRSNIIPS